MVAGERRAIVNGNEGNAVAAAAALAGFVAAFLAWCQQAGMVREIAERIRAMAQDWAENRAGKIIMEIRDAVWSTAFRKPLIAGNKAVLHTALQITLFLRADNE